MCALLRAKLTAPAPDAAAIARRHLVHRLDDGAPGALRTVIAPAGWGKSSVLAQWVHAAEVPVAYVALDGFDNDPARCWLHLLSAVGRAVRVDLADLIGALRLPMPSLVPDIVEPLLERLDERELRLVLDDLHRVADAAVLESLRALIDLSPPTLSIGIGSRSEPALGLERRRVAGELVELRLHELAMSVAEASELLEHAAGRPVTPACAEALARRAEGWPAGLCLAGLALRSSVDDREVVDRFSGDDREVGGYFAAETLSLASERDREFLLGTAVLAELDAPLCDAVRHAHDSARRLVEIARANQFVIPSDNRSRYRYHQLFQEWLVHELAKSDPGALSDAHRRAARAYAARDDAIPAMDHALEAADWTLAHDLFRRFALALIGDGHHATVARWCARFPDTIEAEQMIAIRLTQAWEGVLEGDVDAAERYCRLIEILGSGESPLDEWSGDPGQLAVIRAFCCLLRGQLADAADEIDVARRHCVAERIELPLRFVAAITDYWLGDPDASAFADVAARAEACGDFYAVLLADAYIAHIRLDRLEHRGAEAKIERVFAIAEERVMSAFWYGASAHLARARIALARADYTPAVVDADRAIELAGRRGDLLVLCSAHLVRAEAAHGLNDRQGAREHVALASDLLEPLGPRGVLPERLRVIERQLRAPPRRRVSRVSGPPFEELSDRETALLRLLPGELSQRELGDALHVSLNTIKTHNRSIYRKLGVSSRDDAVVVARVAGLL